MYEERIAKLRNRGHRIGSSAISHDGKVLIGVDDKMFTIPEIDELLQPRIPIEVICPRGHKSQLMFTRSEIRKGLDAKTLPYWCFNCDIRWEPTAEELDGLKNLLENS